MINLLQSQKQQHKILPHHIALLNLLHLDSMSLEQRIEDEINENPALEESNNSDDALNDKFQRKLFRIFRIGKNTDMMTYRTIKLNTKIIYRPTKCLTARSRKPLISGRN